MRRFLLDSGIAQAYLNRRPKVFGRARVEVAAGNQLGICTPVLGELVYGVEYSSTRAANWKRLRVGLKAWTIWPYTEAAAEQYGRLAAELRRIGRPMQQIDIQLAAIALILKNCTVVSADSDLLAVPGLAVENWAA